MPWNENDLMLCARVPGSDEEGLEAGATFPVKNTHIYIHTKFLLKRVLMTIFCCNIETLNMKLKCNSGMTQS